MALYGAVEGGGTKFVCAVGSGPADRLATARIPTTTPAETLPRVRWFLLDAAAQAGQPLTAIGIATFGPIELDRQSPRYGYMLPTPKPGWSGAPVVPAITAGLDVPVAVDTDVNGAALAEYRWGAAQGCDPALYVTVGTGIGGGVVIGGTPLHGLLHPEMGHIAVPSRPRCRRQPRRVRRHLSLPRRLHGRHGRRRGARRPRRPTGGRSRARRSRLGA